LYGLLADPPSRKGSVEGEEQANSTMPSWKLINGGFIPNIPKQIRLLRQKRKEQEPKQHSERRRGRQAQGDDQNYNLGASNIDIRRDAEKLETSNASSSSATTTSRTYLGGVLQVTDILQYKKEVVDVDDQIVAVRFYAPWCKACKAVESPFRKLSTTTSSNGGFSDKKVKFVEVPVTKDNAYLHKGLDVPSLPYAHIYYPTGQLVEELKINKHVFKDFTRILKTYVDGECPVIYDQDSNVGEEDS
jgi:thiol-disulfide isomerase/thioredoxin